MINEVYVFHSERDYFGSKHDVESSMSLVCEERVLKAVDKFFRLARTYEHRYDVLHIETEDRHYVITCENDQPRWFYFYGPQANRTEEQDVTRAEVAKMVRENF